MSGDAGGDPEPGRRRFARWRPAGPADETIRRWRGRWTRTIFLALVTGVLTGLAVAGFELVAGRLLLERLLEAPLAVQAGAPLVGLALAAVALRFVGRGASPSTADEVVRAYHEGPRIALRALPGRMLASIATLGSGGAMGFEGPSIHLGAGIGDWVQRRTRQVFSREDTKILMLAGAAAGVSAIFKTPATGAIFALEVPYQRDLASRAVIPALVASASSYVTYVAFYGTAPLLQGSGRPFFDASDLLGAAAIGILCGVGARLFAAYVVRTKRMATTLPAAWRVLASGVALGCLVVASDLLFDEPLSLGPGNPESVRWALDPSHAAGLVALLFLVRAAATGLTIAGGGAGGVFIPLVVQGALLGRLAAELSGTSQRSLFTLVGAAAFLGAGYRTPIAAVVFIAESTGQPGLVVPGLIATALAQFLMGDATVAPDQLPERRGHLERRLTLPVSTALRADVHTCPPDADLEEVLHVHFLRARAESIPVVEDGRYLGTVNLVDVQRVRREARRTTTAREVMRTDLPVATLGWSLRQVSVAMEDAAIDRVPVTKADGTLVGLVTTHELLELSEVLLEIEE